MEKHERAFKGIWIPAEIWLSDDLTVMEKIFLVEIDSLDNEHGCFASNKYFADFFGISKGRVSQIIKSLGDKNRIIMTYDYEGKEIKNRTIKVKNKEKDPIKDIKGGIKNIKGGIKNIKHPYLENDKDNNTSFNNTFNNTFNKNYSPAEPNDALPYKKIIDYLNNKAEKKYRHTTKKTKELIKARYNEGFELEDFKHVIDIKTKEWKNTNMDTYLRPETLFGTKFEGYLNQKEVANKINGYSNNYNQPLKNNNIPTEKPVRISLDD